MRRRVPDDPAGEEAEKRKLERDLAERGIVLPKTVKIPISYADVVKESVVVPKKRIKKVVVKKIIKKKGKK